MWKTRGKLPWKLIYLNGVILSTSNWWFTAGYHIIPTNDCQCFDTNHIGYHIIPYNTILYLPTIDTILYCYPTTIPKSSAIYHHGFIHPFTISWPQGWPELPLDARAPAAALGSRLSPVRAARGQPTPGGWRLFEMLGMWGFLCRKNRKEVELKTLRFISLGYIKVDFDFGTSGD